MSALCLLVLLATVDLVPLISVGMTTVDSRPAVQLVSAQPLSDPVVERHGDELWVRVTARPPQVAGPISALAPVQAVRIEPIPEGVRLRIRVGDVPYEVRRQGRTLSVLFGDRPGARPAVPVAAASAEVGDLYKQILPLPPVAAAEGADVLQPVAGDRPETTAERPDGISLGPAVLRPALSGAYVDADLALDSPTPVREHYYEIRPRVTAEMPLGLGRIQAGYEARFRQASSFDLVKHTTHLADAALELPIGPWLTLMGSDHYARGVLETTEVDPGREYFFNLGRFEHNEVTASSRLRIGTRATLRLGGSLNQVQVDQTVTFFDYEIRRGDAGIELEIGPNLRAGLGYLYQEIPFTAERPEAQSRAHSGVIRLEGELFPLVTAHIAAGYEDQRNPQAAAGGTRYRGLSLDARLIKEFSRSANLVLSASRRTPPSAFEGNGFYVATLVQAEVSSPLPLAIAFRTGIGYQWNDYQTAAAALGEPRQDRILAWTVGLGRPVTGWGYLRADYRREKRDSNLNPFDVSSHAFIVEAGLRLYHTREYGR